MLFNWNITEVVQLENIHSLNDRDKNDAKIVIYYER